jgi:hypothetical protein
MVSVQVSLLIIVKYSTEDALFISHHKLSEYGIPSYCQIQNYLN